MKPKLHKLRLKFPRVKVSFLVCTLDRRHNRIYSAAIISPLAKILSTAINFSLVSERFSYSVFTVVSLTKDFLKIEFVFRE